MGKILARFILGLLGWKVTGEKPEHIRKAVFIMAPHTSGWDFVFGFLGYAALGVRTRYLIKKEMFVFPLGILLKALGAIPVDREKSTPILMQTGRLFKTSDEFYLTITPEGTRRLNYNWKKGFYHIATNAGVPIILAYLDYDLKTGGIGPAIYPSGDYEADLKVIKDYFRNIHAKFPEHFSESPRNIAHKAGEKASGQ